MAEKKSRFKNIKTINSTLKTINSLMDGIYKTTYNSDRNSVEIIDKVTSDIETNINNIISRNNMADISNVSKLYSRMKLKDISGDKNFSKSVESLFDDPSITMDALALYTENRWIKELDIEYDTILKYMPRLQEALQAKKENVLSSDNFAKDFLNESTTDITNQAEQALFSSRMKSLKEKYKLQQFYEESYDNVAKYGEDIIYCVPYSKAISTLLKNKVNTRPGYIQKTTPGGVLESNGVKEISIMENGIINDSQMQESVSNILRDGKIDMPENFKLIIDTRGFLESAFNSHKSILDNLNSLPSSVYETVLEAKDTKFDHTVPDSFELPKDFDSTSSDGFITSTSNADINVKTPGCVLKRLKHENVIPIYIDNICLGYYYVEFLAGSEYDIFVNNDLIHSRDTISFTGVQYQGRSFSNDVVSTQREKLLSYFASNIANNINASFVNNNQDLAKEIYTILKYNDVFNSQGIDSIKITFLPESDVEHIFFKQDPITHRGISDLYYALIPAKLYSCLYITNVLGILTRGNDKRVYYVKQNVEQNIAQTMLNVINQIKRGNFGMREIQNMNSILNITGRFSDFVIPVGPSGEPPIQFEVMQGQEFNPQTDLLNTLEEMAINSTEMPIEFIQNRMQSLDFAVQATTVNAKVLRSTYKRQSIVEYYLSRLQTKIYNSEYGTNINITCTLPTPLFLHMTNINQMIENTRTYVQSIADFEYESTASVEGNDVMKSIFIRNMMRNKLMAYLKLNEVDEMKKLAELEYKKENQTEQ